VQGGLPTFVEVGNSFSAAAISEDNLVGQLATAGSRLAFVGDDTWMQLFPGQFASARPFPSFNVHDLDTVDDGVWQASLPHTVSSGGNKQQLYALKKALCCFPSILSESLLCWESGN
jgi:GPI ethanolamine phosphate transferase 3 subunit O